MPAQAGFFFASVDDHRPLGAFMSANVAQGLRPPGYAPDPLRYSAARSAQLTGARPSKVGCGGVALVQTLGQSHVADSVACEVSQPVVTTRQANKGVKR